MRVLNLYSAPISLVGSYVVFNSSRGQPHPKYKANSAQTSHIAVWERDPLGVTGDELHDGAE